MDGFMQNAQLPTGRKNSPDENTPDWIFIIPDQCSSHPGKNLPVRQQGLKLV
jgi:hypothetical protein